MCSFTVVLLFFMACTVPVAPEFQDSYSVKPTAGLAGSISFTFAGKAIGVDNYAVYYSETPLDDPLTAPSTAVTLNTYATDGSLKLQLNGLNEGAIYYVWVYPKRGGEVIDSLPMQTVYAYTTVRDYQVVTTESRAQATWLAVNGAEKYSVFKEEATRTSLLAADIFQEAFGLGNRLSDQDSSYVVAYDNDGDILATSSSAVYDPSISLTINAEAGVFPHTVKLRWKEDVNATSYDIISSEVDKTDKVIPGTEKIININPAVDGVIGADPLDSSVRTVSYLMENLADTGYTYQIKGRTNDGDAGFTGFIVARPRQDLPLTPFFAIDSTVPYEMKLGWNREYSEVRDLNGNLLDDLYSNLKYRLTFTRPSDAPTLGGSQIVYPNTSGELNYSQSTYSITYNDSAHISVYQRDIFNRLSVGDYTAQLELIGQNKATGKDIVFGRYTNTVAPNAIQGHALGSQFDGGDELTLDAPTATSSLKNYYRMRTNVTYHDIPLIADLELLPPTGTLNLTSPSLSSLAEKRVVQYEVWTALNGVYVSFGTGSTNTETEEDLVLSAIAGKFPGSLYVSWNASYVRDTSGYSVEYRKTGSTNWTSLADVVHTVTSLIIYDLDLVDETKGNIPIRYDVRLTPKTKVDDGSVVYSRSPGAKLVLETPTKVSYPESYTPFEVKTKYNYISAAGTLPIADIVNRKGVKFADRFKGTTLGPNRRLIITRPSLRPAGVPARYVYDLRLNTYTAVDIIINDVANITYGIVRNGRAYSGGYTIKYQLIGKNKQGGEQILAESAELTDVRGGYLNPIHIGSKSGSDDLALSSDVDAKRKPRRFTKLAANGANYQLIYFTTASGHSAVPTQPDIDSINNSRQIYKLGDGSPNFADDLRRHEGLGGVYYIQIYTYRTSDDLLIGSKFKAFNSSFVLQPMFTWDGEHDGRLPFVNWFMPYLRDQDTGATYYFANYNTLTLANSSGVGSYPLRWFNKFKIASGITNASGSVLYSEEFVPTDTDGTFNALVRFYRVYHHRNAAFSGYPYTYFYDPATGARFGRGVGHTGVFGHYIGYDNSYPVGYAGTYLLHPGP